MQLSATRTYLFAVLPILAVLIVAATFVWRFAASERAQQSWVTHTYAVMDTAQTVLADLAHAESAQRTYLFTGAAPQLAEERAATARIHADIETLRTRTFDNPAQQNRIGRLQAAIEERINALDAGVSAYAAGGTAAAADVIRQGRGAAATERARATIAEILADEANLLRERTKAAQELEGWLTAAAIAFAALVLLLAVVFALILSRNFARLRASEADRGRQAQLLQSTLDSIRDGVAAFNANGDILAFNRTFFHLGAFPDELAVPGSTLKRFHEIDKDRGESFLGDILRPLGENEGLHAAGVVKGRHLECYRTRIPGGGLLISCVDVTQRVRSESIIRQAQKMEAIGQLTGGVAHDFNNLLQVIGANIELTADAVRGDSKAAARLQSAMFGVERASRLTKQLLAFARRQPLEPRSLDLGLVIRDMREILQRTLGERIEMESVLAGGLWNALIDPSQFENAVLNLAINARDAMPDGGKLTLELANASLDDAYARDNPDVVPGQYVMLAVTDTGTGMTPDVMSRAFDPFFTTKKEGEGTGLGLSQVYGFVKQSGGHIKFYSEVGQGTTVKVYLPRTRKPTDTSVALAGPPLEGGDETILVVEDDDGVRASVVDLLSDFGYTVLKAANAGEALTVLSQNPAVDLLFTDVVMPGPIATRDFVQRAQALQPAMKVIYTSGYTHNAIVHNGRLDEGVALISKPYRKEELARKVRNVLGRAQARMGTPAASPPERIPSAASSAAPAGTVLIVEDDPLVRLGIVDLVEQLGFKAIDVPNATRGLELLEKDPEIAILLTDIGLPGMKGDELARVAKKRWPGLAIILSSGYSTAITDPEGTAAIATMLHKPYDLEQLRSALATAGAAR